MTENTSLKIPVKPPIGGLKKGILANKAEHDLHMSSIDPKTVPNRLGLVIDDSGSMGSDGMQNAHKAVQGFTANCNMKDTSIAVYPLNKEAKHLVCDYDLVNLYVSGLQATGSTSIYTVLEKLITDESITRAVLFSDGSPTDSSILSITSRSDWYSSRLPELAQKVIKLYQQKELPIDTIYIGIENSTGYNEMKEIARLTNGIFIHFKDSLSLASGLKYLSPAHRVMLLANPEIKERIQRGEQI